MAAVVEHDFEAELRLLRAPRAARGEQEHAFMEFGHALGGGAPVLGVHTLLEGAPGAPVRTRVRLREAAAYPRSLRVDREIELSVGELRVGIARVLRVERAVLDADSKEPIPVGDVARVVCAMGQTLRQRGVTFREHLEGLRLGETPSCVGVGELMTCLLEDRDWVDQWYAWAEEQRLRAGPFLFRYQQGGWTGFYECSGVAMESKRFDDPVRACAEFLMLQLEGSQLGF